MTQAILLGSFALVASLYEPARPLALSMMPAYLLLPLFQTIALYNTAYSREGLIRWQGAAARCLMALLVSTLLLNFFAFLTKSSAEFSRVVFASSVVIAGLAMTALRLMVARLNIRMWGPA